MMVPWQQWAHSHGDSERKPEGEATQAGGDRELREGPHSRLLDLAHVAGFESSPSLGILPPNPPQSVGIVTQEAWGGTRQGGRGGKNCAHLLCRLPHGIQYELRDDKT